MTANLMSVLKLLRRARGMSLDEVGLRVGVSGSYLSRVERGYARLSPESEKALVAFLGGERILKQIETAPRPLDTTENVEEVSK